MFSCRDVDLCDVVRSIFYRTLTELRNKGSDTVDTAIRFVPPCRIGTGCMYWTLKLECPLGSVVKYCRVLRTLVPDQ
jgi:hypothetical protein